MEKDLSFGFSQESKLQPLIETITGVLTRTQPYDLFDYYNDTYLVELKSRNNHYSKYPTTMVGYNKLVAAAKSDKDVLFFFKFTDGLYYHKYDKTFEYIVDMGGRCDRGKPEYKKYCYIPITQLIFVPNISPLI